MDTLEKLLATTKTGLRVILLRDLVIDEEVEAVIKQLENRGIRVERVKEELTCRDAIERMEGSWRRSVKWRKRELFVASNGWCTRGVSIWSA